MLDHLLFLDIETVAAQKAYHDLSERMQQLWNKKAALLRNPEEQSVEELYERAGIYAEFGKVITIAVGYFRRQQDGLTLRIKDFSGHDEPELLRDFKTLVEEKFHQGRLYLCAHNGKEFDFPYLSRRMIIHGIGLPQCLQLTGKKPWEIPHIDTMELWKFGDYKHFTSLDLLAAIFGISTSKSDLEGSQVNRVYHDEDGLDRIARYCKRDVAVLAQVYLKLTQQPDLDPDKIIML